MLNKVNFSLLAFLAISIKILIRGASPTDGIVLLAVSALYGFTLFLQKRYKEELPLNEEIKRELESLKSSISALKLGQSQKRF